MLLRFLYFIGLTNLSKKQIENFEKARLGFKLFAPTLFLLSLLILLPISIIAHKLEIISPEAFYITISGYILLPIIDIVSITTSKLISNLNNRKILSYITIGIIFFGAILFLSQSVALAKYRDKIIQYSNIILNSYDLLKGNEDKNKIVKIRINKKINPELFSDIDSFKKNKQSIDDKSIISSDKEAINNVSNNRIETINPSKYSLTANMEKNVTVYVLNNTLDFDVDNLIGEIKNELIKRDDKYYYLLDKEYPIVDFYNIIKSECPIDVYVPGLVDIQTFKTESLVINNYSFSALTNQSKSILISAPELYFYNDLWVTRRVGDLRFKMIHIENTERYGVIINKILYNRNLWDFLGIKEGDIIINIGEFKFKSKVPNFMSLFNYLVQSDFRDIKILIARDNEVIQKWFIERGPYKDNLRD